MALSTDRQRKYAHNNLASFPGRFFTNRTPGEKYVFSPAVLYLRNIGLGTRLTTTTPTIPIGGWGCKTKCSSRSTACSCKTRYTSTEGKQEGWTRRSAQCVTHQPATYELVIWIKSGKLTSEVGINVKVLVYNLLMNSL